MKPNSVAFARRAAFAACLLACGVASDASANFAYWHGWKNADWSEGITPGTQSSNWYTQPPPTPNGLASQPPTDTALFARGGKTSVSITEITAIPAIRFLSGAPRYGFLISGENRRLNLTGRGLINEATTTPAFTVHNRGRMFFSNAARINSVEGIKTPISILGGGLHFIDDSKGGSANVTNTSLGALAGLVQFLDRSSAGQMTITNNGNALLQFSGRSTAGLARLINNADFITSKKPLIQLDITRGPAGDRKVSSGAIANNAGRLSIGENEIAVHGDFIQRAEGALFLLAIGRRAGGIKVRGNAKIGGVLVVHSTGSASGVQVGRHVIVSATGALTGKFSHLDVRDFPNHLRVRIAYMGTSVVMFIERK